MMPTMLQVQGFLLALLAPLFLGSQGRRHCFKQPATVLNAFDCFRLWIR